MKIRQPVDTPKSNRVYSNRKCSLNGDQTMTIAASYLVSDGVVFGADSSTTVEVQGTGVVQLLTHSQKVFEVGTNSRFGVCTWGAGSIGKTSHRTIIAQLADQINNQTTVQEAAEKLTTLYSR